MGVQRFAPELEVKIGGRVMPNARVLSLESTIGGRLLDNAVIELVYMPRDETSSAGVTITDFEQKQCEITKITKGGNRETLHVGFIDVRTIITDASESQRVASRVEPYHFGYPITFQWVWSPLLKSSYISHDPIIFNPEIDGKVVGNLSTKLTENSLPLFLHPEASRTEASIKANGSTEAKFWTLPYAVLFLCKVVNGAERIFKNPTLIDLVSILPSDVGVLRNHRQPFGEHLPAQLDALLEPYGYGWYLDPKLRKITLFKRGDGTPIRTKLQGIGERVDMQQSTTEEMHISADVASRLANIVVIAGDKYEIESTFLLKPAWSSKYDAYPESLENLKKLQKGGGESKAWDANPELARVWRDWVLNEGGDYVGVREETDTPYDFNRLTHPGRSQTTVMHRRRKFLPCITLGDDGAPIGAYHGVDVEYFHYKLDADGDPTGEEEGADGEWRPVSELGPECCHIKILEKECGIRFDGNHIPVLLAKYGLGWAKVRVTATVEMDWRMEMSSRSKNSINEKDVPLFLDMGSRFKYRAVATESKYHGGDYKTSEVDDHKAGEKLAAELLDNWDQASINGTIVLPGTAWDIGNPLGKPFAGIAGRAIDFRTNKGKKAKYPMVTGFKFDFLGDKITLSLDTWRRETI